jgi:hypothetical protein
VSIYDWTPWEGNKDSHTLTLDNRHFWAEKWTGGWGLYELDAPGGFAVRKIADEMNWSEIDLALQQYIGGN